MRWLLRLAVAFAIWIPVLGFAATGLIAFRYHRFVEQAFAPVIWLCEACTPVAWQTRGNILLGLGWIGIGIMVYAVIFAIATILASDAWHSWATQRHAEPGVGADSR